MPTDFLKQSLAPLSSRAWDFLHEEAKTVLRAALAGRRVVDVTEPRGFDYSAVNLGKLSDLGTLSGGSVRYGIRRVLPLVEVRVDFSMDIWGLDDLSRGAPSADTGSLVEACTKLAHLENQAIFHGFADAGMIGIAEASKHDPIALASDPLGLPDAVARGVLALREAGVGGPYALVLGTNEYRSLFSNPAPYPIYRRISELIEGPLLHCTAVEGGALVSTRGGDLELCLGLDSSLGYERHDERNVQLYLTETFAFRMVDEDAALALSRVAG